MKTKLLNLLAVTGIAMASPSAFAADGTITINGSVTASTCTVSSSAGSNDFTVTLPKVSTSNLSAAGKTAGRTAFDITLSACNPDTGNVRAHFESGSTVDPASGRLITTTGTGASSNVQIHLTNADGSSIVAGAPAATQNSKTAALATGAATLRYAAEYYATGASTAGTANSSVTYSIVYQ